MSSTYTSFLICEHAQAINIYLEGQPVATYYKGTQVLEVNPNLRGEDVKRAEDLVTSVLLLLKGHADQIAKAVTRV